MNARAHSFWCAFLLCAGLQSLTIAPWPGWCQTPTGRPTPLVLYPDQQDQEDLEWTENFQRAIEQGKFYEVRPKILEYLKTRPDSWKAYYLLGYGLFQTRDRIRSIVALKKVLELKPDHAEAHKVLGLNYVFLNRLDEAESEMQNAAELLPDSPEIRYYLGRVYYNRGAFPLAREEFEKTIRLDPTHVRAFDNLGLTHQALGNDAAAIENYLKAIRLCKEKGVKLEWPYINLASLYNRRNDPAQALRFAQEAVKINPQSHPAYFQIAKAYHSREEWEESIQALRKAIDLNPNFFEYHYSLSQILRRAGRIKESQKEVEIFMKLRSGPEMPERESSSADSSQ